MPTLTDWMQELLACGEFLPDDLRDRIVALGEAAREKLLLVATETEYRGYGAVGEGFAPYFALELLEELPPDDATVARLIESILAEPDTPAADAIAEALASMGDVAVPRLIAALDAAASPNIAGLLAATLAACEARSEAIFAALSSAFARFPDDAAIALGDYGDLRALPSLLRGLDQAQVRAGMTIEAEHGVLDMADAIAALGGTLTEEQATKVRHAQMRQERRALREERDAPPDEEDEVESTRPPGPNEPCPCGSGRKFKKCCA